MKSNNSDNEIEIEYQKMATETEEQDQSSFGLGAIAETTTPPVRSTVLLNSTALNQMNMQEPQAASRETNNTDQSALLDSDNNEIQRSDPSFIDNEINESFVSESAEPEPAATASTRDSDGGMSTVMNDILTSPFRQIKKITDSANAPLQAIVKKGKISKFMNITNVLADFIPVVGGHSSSLHNSRMMTKSRRLFDTVNVDELEQHPLHKAVAMSAAWSATLSSKNIQSGGDLKTIKTLVNEDPTQLHKQLTSSGDTPLHIAVRFGAIQWHHTRDYRGATTNLPIIEYLIQADINFRRKKAVGERKEAGRTSPINLGSLVMESALYIQDNRRELPLHLAADEGYEGAVMMLLQVDKDANFATLHVSNLDGNLPLHLSVLRDDLAIVKILLAADSKRTKILMESSEMSPQSKLAIFHRNKNGDLPLHVSLSSPHKFKIWDLLLQADANKDTLSVTNDQGVSPYSFFVNQPRLCKYEPDFVDVHLSEAILNSLLSGKHLVEQWDELLKRSVAKSRKMQIMMNRAAANRLPTGIFMADFVAHLLSIATILKATSEYLSNGEPQLVWVANILFVLVAYFTSREFVQLLLSKNLYWSDFWNYPDLVRIALLTILALMLRGGFLDLTMERHVYFARRLLLALAVFVYLGVISFLRMTYLPFALFVGGVSEILITLIPFMVTFVLALGLFAYGYWVGGFISPYTEKYISYVDWLIATFATAVGEPGNFLFMEHSYIDSVAWTILFIIVIQILLLNVLIAVITSAWEDITEVQNDVFWKYRLEYATGVLPIERYLTKYLSGSRLSRFIERITRLIDSLDATRIRDNVNWESDPYCKVVRDPSIYWDELRWTSLFAGNGRGENARDSTRSGMNFSGSQDNSSSTQWEKFDHRDFVDGSPPLLIRSYEADLKFSVSRIRRMCILLRLCGYFAGWFLCFVFGFFTFGFTWPRSVRTFFCAPSTTTSSRKDEPSESLSQTNEAHFAVSHLDISLSTPGLKSSSEERNADLEQKIDDMAETIEALRKTVELLLELHKKREEVPG